MALKTDPELIHPESLARARLPDVEAVKAFVTTAAAGSMREAARDLRTSPTSVRRAIARLERHVGERLLTRSRHGVRLTAYGRAQIVNATRAVYILAQSFASARSMRGYT